jgi:hypothetical protein
MGAPVGPAHGGRLAVVMDGDDDVLPVAVRDLPNPFFFASGAFVITGPPLIFVAAHLVLRCPAIWLPDFLGESSIDRQVFGRVVARAVPWIERVKRLVRPHNWVLLRQIADITVGLACLVIAIFMFLPIPFANTLPALSVIIMVLGLSERDGLWLLGGFIISLASFADVAAIFAAGAFAMLSFFWPLRLRFLMAHCIYVQRQIISFEY